jgi:hypothetical protein
VVAEPEKVDDVDVIAAFEKFGNENAADVTCSACDENFHVYLRG